MGFLKNTVRAKKKELGLKISKRSLKKALQGKSVKIIAEIKQKSPSKGILRTNLDVAKVLKYYNKYACAVSVVTDARFNGSFDLVREVRAETKLPILVKDFVLHELQLFEAKLSGADAILLLASLLDNKKINEFIAKGKEIGLECLVEVHSKEEMKRVLKSKAELIGVNNRNLRTLKIDLENAERILQSVPKREFEKRIFIAESGYENYSQISNLNGKVNAFLVGSSLMLAKNLDNKLRELKGEL
ncbi:MAG: indole-3-glycerol phosphate synthase TrpC [Candidatus Diapherotrites archaeon]|nr:indole-3-glycerol phosphate synthase TrpC [Candidatus Diapherotrites archaeon]